MRPWSGLAGASTAALVCSALFGCAIVAVPDAAATTCVTFLAQSREDQELLIDEATDQVTFAVYSPAGAVAMTPWQYLQAMCATPANSRLSIEQALARTAAPTCEQFLATPAQVRREWVKLRSSSELGELEGEGAIHWDDDAVMESLTAACLAGGSLDAAMALVESGATPAPYVPEPNYDYGLPHGLTWTTATRQGVLVGGNLQFGDEVVGGPDPTWGPYDNSLITAGDGCGYDPQTDGVIAGRITAVNRSDSPAQVSVGFKVTHLGFGDTAVAVDSGSYCDTEGAYGYAGLTIVSENTDLVAPGETFSIAFFVILRNYFSPSHPSGATWELADYVVAPYGASPNNDDDWIAIQPQDVSLSLDVVGTADDVFAQPPGK